MKLAVLSVILLTALVELASTVAIAQRGLSSGQSADRPSAPSNTRVAQNSARLRVLRGGNLLSKASDVRSPARFRYDVDLRYYANGFRVARELQ
jgi:formylglycine-generating enzyme required for sulfatase activity